MTPDAAERSRPTPSCPRWCLNDRTRNGNEEDAWRRSTNPLITSARRSEGDVLNTPDPRRWRSLALLSGAFFMVILDATIVLVALPAIQADIGFSEQCLRGC